ncbi:thioesterase [Actinomadura graeca]|uniref:Thioesterase n=2 Tax=Actinomadura graeca TaxID=2750812 RepID=A0ABX8QYF4_9ACTN|nr:alpha/beta fold hydrolase [Actinomadura graeca]QXJ21803.1 thioesterase [Actinomadura graeca]
MSSKPYPLVCLPFAGSGAGFYRSWAEIPTNGITVLPMQLPGREELFLDDPFTDVIEAAAYLATRIADLTAEMPSFGLFGHSLGAVLCYEIARELERAGHRGLAHLYVSGSPGPCNGRDIRATGLDDAGFLERVQEFAGYRHEAFDDPGLRELLLPVLRADVAMHENYKPAPEAHLRVPVTSLRGEEDALVTREHALQWRDVTEADFTYLELSGGHMYLVDSPEVLLRTIAGS